MLIRIDHTKSYRGQAKLRLAKENIIEQVSQSQSVYSCGNPKLQTVGKHIHRVGVQIGGTFYNTFEYFCFCTARHDSQFFPAFNTWCICDFLNQFCRNIFRFVQIGKYGICHFFCFYIDIFVCNSKHLCQMLQRFQTL